MGTDVFVTQNYEKLKKIAFKEMSFLSSIEAREDIFHDTLLKCIKQLKSNQITKDDFLPYFSKAVKINGWREMKYANNSLVNDSECDFNDFEDSKCELDTSLIDYELIGEEIKKTFGFKIFEVFMLWSQNYTIQEINDKLNIKNSRYTIDKLKKWLTRYL